MGRCRGNFLSLTDSIWGMMATEIELVQGWRNAQTPIPRLIKGVIETLTYFHNCLIRTQHSLLQYSRDEES